MEAKVPAKYFNEVQVAGFTGRALSTLRNERARNEGIPYIKVGRSVRYDLQDVIEFMDSHRVMTRCPLHSDQRGEDKMTTRHPDKVSLTKTEMNRGD